MMTRLRYWPTAWGLGGFLAVSYVVCVAWDGLFPSWAMREAWQGLLPGFTWLSPGSFLLGLAETVLYGFWLALLVPLVSLAHGSPRVHAPVTAGGLTGNQAGGRRRARTDRS